MSTIKVNKIENTSTTDGGISIDNSGHVTVDGQQLPSAGPLSNRNLVVNGAMRVAQRATSKASITTQAYHTVDRFNLNINALGTWTMSQESSGPDGFAHSLKLLCTTADASPAAADVALIIYRVEGQDLQQLEYGTAGAKQSTLSFYVKSNKTGNATVNLKQPDASNRIYSAQYTISSANTWERKTIVVPADTSGTINDDTGNGLQIEWPLNTGSDYTGGSHGGWKAADNTSRNNSNLGVGGAVNDYYEITGVQLEVGSVATPFEHRSFGEELAKCKRYFQKSYSYGTAVGANTTDGRYYFLLGVDTAARNKGGSVYLGYEMRAAPTVNFYNDAGTQGVIQSPASSATPLLLKTGVIAMYVGNTAATEIAGAWTAEAEL